MFDIGFTELVVIGVVALIVLGPERLPRVARTAGHLFGRFQRYVSNVKADIQREMDAAELGKLKTEVQDAALAFEQSVNKEVGTAQTEMQALEHSMSETVKDAAPVAEATNAPTDIEAPVQPDSEALPDLTAQQQLELGISGEPYAPPTTQQKLVN